MPRGGSPPRGRNIARAIATGLVLAGLLFGALFWSPLAFLLLATAVVLVAQYELYAALARRGLRPAIPLGLAVGVVLMVGAHARGPDALSFGLVIAVLGALLWYLADPARVNVTAGVGATLLGVVYVPFCAAHVVLIRGLPEGIELTVAAIGAAAVSDIGGYAAGSLVGRRPLAPSVSPAKTWEGVAGATVIVFAVALAIGPLFGPLDLGSSAALAAAAAAAAPLGDLSESLLKRDLDVKDMGTLLPGHGGVLDRIDSLLFVLPASYWLFRAVL